MSAPPDPDRWRRIDAILEAALEAPAAERAEIVARACGADEALRLEVSSLIEADARAGAFLDTGALAEVAARVLANGRPFEVGQVLADRYRIEEPLGSGGMGAVYRAHDRLLGTDVAVKALEPGLAQRPAQLEALRREVRLARLVTHANVCRVHDLVEDASGPFLTMEYVPGESLAARLERQGALPVAECTRLLTGIACGLGAAHAAGVVHRDLKPANVLLREGSGEPVVADFGIAADAAGGAGDATPLGTRGYVAPEQRAGAAPDARSDLYSLGVLAHRMAAGRLPGEEGPRALPRELVPLVEATLRERPEERPPDAAAAVALIERATKGVERPRRRLVLQALVAALVAPVAFVVGDRRWGPSGPVVLSDVDTSALADVWIGEGLRRLVIGELVDAWGLDARPAAKGATPPGAVGLRVWRDIPGRLHAAIALPGERGREIDGATLRTLAEGAARRIAERAAARDRHPTREELRAVGAHDAEAWRDFRRARRAARMEMWGRVRALTRRAIERDPEFPMAWLESDLTYNQEDRAREPILDQVVALGDRAQGLSPLSRLAIDFARASRAKDGPAIGAVLARIGALELDDHDRLYVEYRLAALHFALGEPERGLAPLERMTEEWPQDAAAPKRLADYYLGLDEPVSPSLALRYAQRAVELAPEDVAARANLARAQLLMGDAAAARAEREVIAHAGPDDKQEAFVTERMNRVFLLHMGLGDIEDAAADARRLMLEPGVRHAQGQIAMGVVDLARGAFDDGLAALAAAAGELERAGMSVLAVDAHSQRAWHAFTLGRYDVTIAAVEDIRRGDRAFRQALAEKLAQRAEVLGALAGFGASGRDPTPAQQAQVRERLAAMWPQGEWLRWQGYLELLLRHRLRNWAGVAALYHELERDAVPLAVTVPAADALERLGRTSDAQILYERLAAHPNAWFQPYGRGLAWLRLGLLRERAGDTAGARAAHTSLLGVWDRAPRDRPEIREAERRLRILGTR